jgi:glycosyltransferase involved in cell wall biosynthesis
MAISLITSLYRSERHLPAQVDFPLEVVLVANDATDTERQLLETFEQGDLFTIQVIFTERETLYASWNRGFEAAQYDFLGAWNVDDRRSIEGLTTAYDALAAGYPLLDFAYDLVQGNQMARFPAPYRSDSLSPKSGLSPFFMLRRELYEAAGSFNPHFTIAGDYEWSKRPAVRAAEYQRLAVVGGQFVRHQDNLSGSRNPLEWVEFNTALIWHEGYEHLRPVDPHLMRQEWAAWGHTGGTIPPALADWLWGAGAAERYAAYTHERNAHPLMRRMRSVLARHTVGQADPQRFKPPKQ